MNDLFLLEPEFHYRANRTRNELRPVRYRRWRKRVADGGSALDPEVVSRLVGRRRGEDPISQLTPREREVLELMAEGRSNQAIAERLVVTLRAVEKHVTSIFSKLDLPADEQDHRRVLAVTAYLRQ